MDVTNKITGFLQAEGSGKSYKYVIQDNKYILNKNIIDIFMSCSSIRSTVKIDGENCLIRNKKFYVRYDWRSTGAILVIKNTRVVAIKPIFKNFNNKKLNRFTRKIIAHDYITPDIQDILNNKIIQDQEYTYKLVSITNASGRDDMLIYTNYYNAGNINFPYIFYGDIQELVFGDINPDTSIPEILYIPDYNINYVDIYEEKEGKVIHDIFIGDVNPGSYENISRKKSGKYNYLLEQDYLDNILLVSHGSITPDNKYLQDIKYPDLNPDSIYAFVIDLFYHTIDYCFGGEKHREGVVFYLDDKYKLKINVGHMRTFLKDLDQINHDFDLSHIHIPGEDVFDKIEKNLSF